MRYLLLMLLAFPAYAQQWECSPIKEIAPVMQDLQKIQTLPMQNFRNVMLRGASVTYLPPPTKAGDFPTPPNVGVNGKK